MNSKRRASSLTHSSPHRRARAMRSAIGLLFLFLASVPSVVHPGGVVGSGTADSCTDAALDAALAGGGVVTFDCGGSATINISMGSGTKTIAADTTIDGGGEITISGGHAV